MTQPTPIEPEFVQFGPAHLAVIALLIVFSIMLPAAVRYSKSERIKWTIRLSLVAVLLGVEWFKCVYMITQNGFDDFIQNDLPLHACGMAIYLTSWVLITKKQVAFEIAYFWGLAGTTQAILTPALTDGFPSVPFFLFFVAHCAIIVGVLVAVFGLKMRPRLKGLWITYALTWTLVFVVGGINALLGSNYMYLCSPPDGTSPFYFLLWPWYLLFQGAFALAAFWILYLPFGVFRHKNDR